MMSYDRITVSGASGVGYSKTAVGAVEWIKVTYANGAVGGDVVITDDQTGLAFLTLTDNNTDKSGPVLGQALSATGAALSAYDKPPVVSRFKVQTAQQASNTTVTVEVWWSA